jgi:hypothetical protein
MSISPPPGFSWNNFKCYPAFDGLIKNIICEQRSWLLVEPEPIDVDNALAEIRERFIDGFDEGKATFDQKAQLQFADASRNAKLLFIHVEYLWAMHSFLIKRDTKRSFALRWFTDDEVRDDEDAYFQGTDDTIANPGPYYQTNKYNEVRATLRILSLVFHGPENTSLEATKNKIKVESYRALHGSPKPVNGFRAKHYCGIHAALMHLCNPDEYESIISKGHRKSILGVFAHEVADRTDITCPEEQIKLIREKLYEDFSDDNPERKFRWFFYTPAVKALWIDKEGRYQQIFASIQREIQDEVDAPPFEDDEEGMPIKTKGTRLQRSAALVKSTKKRDNYTCRGCDFHFRNEIVHAHHLDPLAERARRKTSPDDLVTLCPNCHYLAHYQLRQDNGDQFKKLDTLLTKLSSLHRKKLNQAP